MPYLDTPAGRLHYQESGGGQTVIALHGSASSGSQWRTLTGCIEGHFRVLTPDLPGYGKSAPVAAPNEARLEDIAEQIHYLVISCGDRVHLVGHSFGGAVALKLAQMYPDDICSLSLIEPTAFHLLPSETAEDRDLVRSIRGVADALSSFACEGDPRTGMARFVDFWNGDGAFFRSSPGLKARMTGNIGQVLDDFAAIDNEQGTTVSLSRLRVPVLCIAGAETPAVSLRTTETVVEALPFTRLEIVSGAGHMVPLTDPHITDPMIRRHLLDTSHRFVRGRFPTPPAIRPDA